MKIILLLLLISLSIPIGAAVYLPLVNNSRSTGYWLDYYEGKELDEVGYTEGQRRGSYVLLHCHKWSAEQGLRDWWEINTPAGVVWIGGVRW